MTKNFFEMTSAEREADVAKLERGVSFDETRPLSAKGKALWELAKRGPGRPPKPKGEKAARFLVSMDPKLLTVVEAFASSKGLDRSKLIALSVRAFMAADDAHQQVRPDSEGNDRRRANKRATRGSRTVRRDDATAAR